MGIAPVALKEPAHLLVHHGMANHVTIKLGLLLCRWQLAVQQKIAGLEEIPVLGQLPDGIAPIEQDTRIPVEIVILDSQLAVDVNPGS